MRINLARETQNNRLAVLTLLALCLFQQPALTAPATTTNTVASQSSNSNGDDDMVFFIGGIPLGFVPGETIRITVFNSSKAQPQARDGRKFRMLVAPLVLDAQGNVVGLKDEISVAPGELHSFDFARDDIALAGEPGTGRLQVRAEVRYRFFSIVDRTQVTPDKFPASFEIVDDRTGETTAMISRKPKEIVVGGSH